MDSNIDIGSKLKARRQELGFSVEHVSSKTLINRQYITAIEENRFRDMPAEVFLLGALKNYSKFIGLNPEEIIAEYKKNNPPMATPVVLSISHSDIVKQKSNKNSFKRLILLITAVLAGTILVALLIKTVIRTAGTMKAEKAEKKLQKNILELRTTEDVWIRIKEEDSQIFEGILSPNTVKTFEIEKNPVLRIGNVHGITVIYNGRTVELPKNRPGGVGEIKLQ